MPETMSLKKAFFFSLMFHAAIIVLITYGPKPEPEPIINAALIDRQQSELDQTRQKEKTIEATSFSTEEVEAAVEKLKQEQEQVKKQRLEKIAAEKRAAQQAKRQRLAEQKQLAALKRETAQRKEQQRNEELRLAALKRESEKLLRQQREEARKKRLEKERRIKAAQEAERLKAEALRAAAEKQARLNEALQKYKVLILRAISQQWIWPPNINSQLSCEFRIRLAPDGTVVLVRLSRSSGDSILDRSAETAINKASPLPVPQEKELFELFRDIRLTVRPEQARG